MRSAAASEEAAASERGVVVDRRDIDDPRAWAELVELLAGLLYPSAPDEPTRR